MEKKYKSKEKMQEKKKNDQMVLSQVEAYQKDQDRVRMERHRKLMAQKQSREFQLKEANDKKKADAEARKEYEQELVNMLKS